MSDEKVEVKLGDHLFRIARQHGFRTIKPITGAAANATLLKQRVNPATLVIGDVVVVPAFEPAQAGAPINTVNAFTVADSGLFLNLVLQDTERRPLAKRAFRLVVAENAIGPGGVTADPVDDVTTAKGEVSGEIPAFTIEGELVLRATDDPASAPVAKIKILVGVLEAANTVRGQQVRLNNMGYFAGFAEKDVDQLRWAIEEFQVDHGIKATGKFDDPVTFNRIAHEHGDLLASERVP